jgi:hypothetical protein
VVAARVLVPLAIPRFPLPAMLAALVIDGVDQTIFQTFTHLDLSGYQSYDKALDVYYLSIAYVATLRNWVHLDAFGVSRFLYYYRLVGVVAFELTQVRALLMVFPNTFEYFFDAYEAVRVRWNPLRMSRRLVIGLAAFIWIFIKLPQEWWIHVAQLDMTDTIKTRVFGVPLTASWADAFAARPWVLVVTAVAVVALVVAAWWVITRRLPAADRPPTFDANKGQPRIPDARVDEVRRREAGRVVSHEVGEKIALIGLVSIVFGQMLPGIDTSPFQIAAGVAVVIVVNALVADWLVRRAIVLGRYSVVGQFVVTTAVNIGIVLVGQLVLDVLRGQTLEHALVFVLLLSLIGTLYDRYRPIHVARFEDEPIPVPIRPELAEPA